MNNFDVNALNKEDKSLLHAAVESNNLGKVKDLLEKHGANVDIQDSKGRTLLYFAITLNRSEEIVRYLVKEAGANTDITNDAGNKLIESTYVQYLKSDKYGKVTLDLLFKSISPEEKDRMLKRLRADIEMQQEASRSSLR